MKSEVVVKSRKATKKPAAKLSDAFHLPSEEAWADLVRDLKLAPEPAHELNLVLSHIAQDFQSHDAKFAGRRPSQELVGRLKRMAKRFQDLHYEIRRSGKLMKDFLPLDTLEEIGLLASFSMMEAALGTALPNRDLGGEVESLAAEDPNFRIADIEAAFAYQRKALGLKRGPELLAHFVERINTPIQTWLEIDRLNRGGRPSNPVRDFVLIRLAESAPEILGSRATATADGKFVRLCTAVFLACGLETEGLEKAVARILKSRFGKPALARAVGSSPSDADAGAEVARAKAMPGSLKQGLAVKARAKP